MILDYINNCNRYATINERFSSAFHWLNTTNLAKLQLGRYDILEDDVYALVQSYTTCKKEDRIMEAHQKYIDIQYIVSGKEIVYFACDNIDLTLKENLLEDSDSLLYFPNGTYTACHLSPDVFAIYFPNEYHMPCCELGEPYDVKKIVIKVKA